MDETNLNKKTASGNGVGKTTVLRLIDFCLGGKGENIYTDPEFKKSKKANETIKSFLKENNIVITLTLTKDISCEQPDIIISRNFLGYKQKIQTINGEKYSNDDFPRTLNRLIFKTNSEKPSFRQLISKNIRDEKNKLVNTIQVLAQNVITDATYEALHLFWFGVDVNLSKDQLVRKKNLEEKLQTRLRQESNLSQINQSLVIIDKEIEKLTKKKENFNLNEQYEQQLEKLDETKYQLNMLSSDLPRLRLRKELILESKADLEKNLANIDVSQIKRMYEKAKSFIPDIQKTFEDTLTFHNEVIQKKIQFITEELPSLEQEIAQKASELNALLDREKELSESLKKAGAIEDLQGIITELNHFHEQKGRFEEQKKQWKTSNKNLKRISNKLKEINGKLDSKDVLIQKRIEEFNSYFSDISNKLDGIHSILSADNSDGIYKFIISNIEGNLGTGSKKSQMASFDLAYIRFADAQDIPCLHFVLQDQIENVHANQITNLFTEVVSKVNCQYVLPVLRDKLPSNIDINEFEVLSLSQNDKLFRI
ncbi:MAG: DUF2326 domain-containing protein [Thiotrichaceae bacterium]|nr:DUF2326 domain-containing protein [Thiotrichaceae bacterium]